MRNRSSTAGPVAAVLLAAGESRRMGKANKLLLPVHGRPMVRHAAETVLASRAGETVAVLGHDAEAVAGALAGLALGTVINRDYRAGQMTSVRAGVAALGEGWAGVLICLADQPALEPGDLNFLIDRFLAGDDDAILVPTHRGERGNPVLVPAVYRHALVGEGVDVGCRRLIERNPDKVRLVEARSARFVDDVDTSAAYANVTVGEGEGRPAPGG